MTTKNAPPRAFAYELELGDGLCHWAEPTRERLERRSLPSPGAKIRAVRIVPEGRYRELLKMEQEFLGWAAEDREITDSILVRQAEQTMRDAIVKEVKKRQRDALGMEAREHLFQILDFIRELTAVDPEAGVQWLKQMDKVEERFRRAAVDTEVGEP